MERNILGRNIATVKSEYLGPSGSIETGALKKWTKDSIN